MKQSSSKWLKTKQGLESFSWQAGYGAFSVSESQKHVVAKYIENQQRHHKKINYQEELREFFNKHGVTFNEQYVWD